MMIIGRQRDFFSLFSLSALALLFCLGGNAFASGVASIDRLKVEERLLPGETREGKIHVSNTQKEVMQLKVYVQDWAYTPAADGSKNFAPPGFLPYSCSSWISLYPDQLTLSPGQSQDVRYTISAPPNVRGGYHSVVFFENLLGQKEQEKGKTVNISARLASLVYVEVVGTTQKQGKVNSLAMTREEGSKILQMKLDFQNTGNCHLILEPTFVLMNQQGALVARGAFPKIYTLPGDSASPETHWPGNLAEGIYDLILTIDLGDNQVLVKEWKITVSPQGSVQEQLS